MKKDIEKSDKSAAKLDRREFLVTSIVAGFALAVQPVSAQTVVKTDAVGLVAGEVKIPVAGGQIPAYRAMPDKKGKKFPVVLVIHEIFGVHEHIQDVCRRFAKLGYMAIAPALYARVGNVDTIANPEQLNREIFSKVPDTDSMAFLDSAVEWAKKNGGNTKKLSITGFCWGGRIVWLYAAHNPKVDAGAAWYGRLVNPSDAPKNDAQPTMPIDYAKNLKVPVIGLYGGQDTGIPLDTVQRMQEELKKGKSNSEIVVYPNAGHAFNADYRPSYNREAAIDAWAKMLDWFKKNGAM
ncbi:MAG TPA: dienelactone hydrolase family protein [Pyrinomonadaceae bacterium]|jgi:carboxymethylenebutenolidase